MASPESGSRISRIAVVVLVLVDVVLVAIVLGMRSGPTTATTATTAVTRTPSSSADPSVSPSRTPSTRATASRRPTPSTRPTPSRSPIPTSAVPVRRLLVAVDDRRAWRVSTGTCAGGGASVSLTTDGGRSWHARTTPFASISRLVVPPGSTGVFAVGADGGCGAQLQRTADSGTTWAGAKGLGGFFYTDPGIAVPSRCRGARRSRRVMAGRSSTWRLTPAASRFCAPTVSFAPSATVTRPGRTGPASAERSR